MSLIAIILAFVLNRGLSDRMNQKSGHNSEKVDDLKDIIAKLENEVNILKSELRLQRQALENNLTSSPEKVVLDKFPSPEKKVIHPAPPPKEKWLNFVQDFNSLSNQSGYDAKKASEEFLKKYAIQAFRCKNFESRVNISSTEPQFDTTSTQNADFWAYEFKAGTFAVVPKAKTYTDNHHTERAMGEIFQSNFKHGGTYDEIRVEKPAIFRGKWNLEKPGILELS